MKLLYPNLIEQVLTKKQLILVSGETDFGPGVWVGVELDDPSGKNDGTVFGIRYFESKDAHGLFIRPNSVRVAHDGDYRR